MAHDQLWAPWRLSYIATTDAVQSDECFLCQYRDARDDQKNLVVARGKRSITVMNRYPYNNGHLLVAPLDHKATLQEFADDELLACLQQIRQMTQVLGEVLKPDGFNIGLNLGQAAGAGLPGHLHWHLVPRWIGDTNFMPVITDTKVIPQSLESLFQLLQTELSK